MTTYLFKKYSFLKKLMYYTVPRAISDKMNDYFIYFPDGCERDEIDEVIDVSSVWENKVRAMYAHRSQIKDIERVMQNQKDLPKEEYFLIREK